MSDVTTPIDPRLGLPSASSTDREINCPGWRPLVKEIVASGQKLQTENELAAQGTRIHAAFETGDVDDLEEDEKTINERLEKLAERAYVDWFATLPPEAKTEPPKEFRERRLWIRRRDTLAPIWSGQLDRYWVWRTHALVIDAKTGYKDAVASERNWQIRTQVVCIWHEHPEVTTIRGGIAASRLRTNLDLSDYAVSDLRAIENILLTASWRSSQPDAPRHAGSWCDYCPAKAWCRSSTTHALIVRSEMQNLKPAEIKQRVAMMRPAALALLWKNHGTIDKIMDAVKDRLKGMPEEELHGYGFKLQPGAKRRTIKDQLDARRMLVEHEKLVTLDELLMCSTIGVKKVETFVAKRNPHLTPEQITSTVEKALGHVLEKSQNDPSLKEI